MISFRRSREVTDDEVFLLQVHPDLGDAVLDFDAEPSGEFLFCRIEPSNPGLRQQCRERMAPLVSLVVSPNDHVL